MMLPYTYTYISISLDFAQVYNAIGADVSLASPFYLKHIISFLCVPRRRVFWCRIFTSNVTRVISTEHFQNIMTL